MKDKFIFIVGAVAAGKTTFMEKKLKIRKQIYSFPFTF